MNSAVVVLLSCLLVLCAQAQPSDRARKCKCSNSLLSRVSRDLLRNMESEPVFHEPSSFCPQLEIIIVLKNKEKCVDPQSVLGKVLLLRKRQKEIAALRTTKVPVQETNTRTSTELYSTTSADTTL